uniref:TonB-dependent receptor-like beta-barrel domain-containing protein n=1 Tax=Phenylobacterium glaciei TaxID=2803784 RepID=A0A974S767_9CAUL|nr:hypothetical protein JKL49_20540 [Phenylobacterium glaciei]
MMTPIRRRSPIACASRAARNTSTTPWTGCRPRWGRYTRHLTPRLDLEAVAFQQWNNNDTKSRFEGANLIRQFEGDRKTTESVGRGHVRFAQSPTLTWEFGAEGAYNKLDNTTTLFQNGAKVRVPAASVLVTEKRGEVFGTATWRPSEAITVEAGLRQERSTISSEGTCCWRSSCSSPSPGWR